MRMTTSALVAGAATSVFAMEDQKVLGKPDSQLHHDLGIDISSGAWTESLQNFFGDASEGIKEIWDEVRPFVPEGFEQVKKQLQGPPPKPATRRGDDEWDHIVQGSDLHDVFIETDGKTHRKFDGKLDTYTLRARSVDPSKLGVDDVKQYSGYLDDNEKDKHLFYWFFESRNDPKNDPVVLWLNGGPGCSSLLGLLFELGPSSIDKNIKPVYNPSAWNSNASVIFLDQPVNVGYSYGSGTVSDTASAGRDVYALMTLFFNQFPEYAEQDFHIAGESYGGHYVPIFASEIMSHENRNINLKSIMVGNGLTDAYEQYPAYPPMACGKGGYDAVLDESTCRSMENAIPRCQSLIKSCYDSESAWTCVPAFIYCNNAVLNPYQRSGQNPYDVREKCEDSENLCYTGTKYAVEWLNKPEVKAALGAEVDTFDSCNFDINRSFGMHGDWMLPIQRVIPGLLEKIPVLLYAGDADFICNWLGNLYWANALEWKGQKGFKDAEWKKLKRGDEKEAYGDWKQHDNFAFFKIFGGGHMVPYDQPEASLDFFNRWVGGEFKKGKKE